MDGVRLNLAPSGSDPAAEFCVSAQGTGTIWVDGPSLVRATDTGLRREAADAFGAHWAPRRFDGPPGLPRRTTTGGAASAEAERPIVAASTGPTKEADEARGAKAAGKAKREDPIPTGAGLLLAAPNDLGSTSSSRSARTWAAPAARGQPAPRPTQHRLGRVLQRSGRIGLGKQRGAHGHEPPYRRQALAGSRRTSPGTPGRWAWTGDAEGAEGTKRRNPPAPSRRMRSRAESPQGVSRGQDPTIRVLEGHYDWKPTGPRIAANAAATLNRLAREGGADAVATCPLVAARQGKPEGLLSAGPAGIAPTPVYRIVHPSARDAVQKLLAADGGAAALEDRPAGRACSRRRSSSARRIVGSPRPR